MAIEGGAQDINVMRSGENVGAATFVNKFSEPFDLEGLWRLVEEDVMKEGGENEEVEMEEPPAGDALQGAMEEDG